MECFLKKYCGLLDKGIDHFTDNVIQAFTRYHWPGNVRELENAVEYAVNMEAGKIISLNSIPGKIRNHWLGHSPENIRLKNHLEDAERDLLAQKIVELSGHNLSKKEIARLMGISRATLYRKIKQYGIKVNNV